MDESSFNYRALLLCPDDDESPPRRGPDHMPLQTRPLTTTDHVTVVTKEQVRTTTDHVTVVTKEPSGRRERGRVLDRPGRSLLAASAGSSEASKDHVLNDRRASASTQASSTSFISGPNSEVSSAQPSALPSPLSVSSSSSTEAEQEHQEPADSVAVLTAHQPEREELPGVDAAARPTQKSSVLLLPGEKQTTPAALSPPTARSPRNSATAHQPSLRPDGSLPEEGIISLAWESIGAPPFLLGSPKRPPQFLLLPNGIDYAVDAKDPSKPRYLTAKERAEFRRQRKEEEARNRSPGPQPTPDDVSAFRESLFQKRVGGRYSFTRDGGGQS